MTSQHSATSPATPTAAAAPPRVVVVGGGFSGASAALQLWRAVAGPLAITVVDPQPGLGRGLAYATPDPQHRLNAPTFVHTLLPEDLWHFTRWCEARQVLREDPEALWADGGVYLRRAYLAMYASETLADAAAQAGPGRSLQHLADRVTAVEGLPLAPVVHTAGGARLPADLVVLATGHPALRWPAALAGLAGCGGQAAQADPTGQGADGRLVVDPFQPGALAAVPRGARVGLLGSGLTALDALSTLLAQGHAGPIGVWSRHGLRPREQVAWPAALQGAGAAPAGTQRPGATLLLDRVMGPPPAWLPLGEGGVLPTARGWLAALRAEVRRLGAEGLPWQSAFDALRDPLWQLWPRLPRAEQRRVLRHLKTWYDVHRYRVPPQNDALVRAAEAAGRVVFERARVQAAEIGSGGVRLTLARPAATGAQPGGDGPAEFEAEVDVLVNATGLDPAAALAQNPVLAQLAAGGWLQRDDLGLGVAVTPEGAVCAADGQPLTRLRVVGPLTVGAFGDPVGAFFIAAQIRRMLPDWLRSLGPASGPK